MHLAWALSEHQPHAAKSKILPTQIPVTEFKIPPAPNPATESKISATQPIAKSGSKNATIKPLHKFKSLVQQKLTTPSVWREFSNYAELCTLQYAEVLEQLCTDADPDLVVTTLGCLPWRHCWHLLCRHRWLVHLEAPLGLGLLTLQHCISK